MKWRCLLAVAGVACATPRPAPVSNAVRAARRDRYVITEPGKPNTAPPALGDVVGFSLTAFDADHKPVKLDVPDRAQPLGDIQVPAVVDALRTMLEGERREVWTQRDGEPLRLTITLYTIEHREQVAPRPDFTRVPAGATIAAPGVQQIILAPGTGEPPDVEDDVTLDYAAWTTAGRTVQGSARPTGPRRVTELSGLAASIADMRTGEHRRIWFAASAAGKLSEGGLGAVADITLREIHRNIELLPGGIRIVHAEPGAAAVRGSTRIALPGSIDQLSSAHLAQGVVTLQGSGRCHPTQDTIPLAQIEARLASEEAAQHLRDGKLDDAIARARQAIARAPELDELYIQLAAIYVKAGKPRDAAHALAPVAARNPVWTYLQLSEQPALRGLTGEPDLQRLRVATPATVELTRMPVVADRRGRFVAVLEEGEVGWGSEDGEPRVEVFDIATHAWLTTIPRVVGPRRHQVERWLGELGFTRVPGLEVASVQPLAAGESRVTFAGAKITIDEAGSIVRGATQVGRLSVIGQIHEAFWLPSLRLLVSHWGGDENEGCEGIDLHGLELTRL